ncbi:hypothetical protein A7D23_08110 [Dehalobacter sp. TeCB1]|nr:hypothetical protein A7D23_08110 [Dehalobacter sp. TeCB1]
MINQAQTAQNIDDNGLIKKIMIIQLLFWLGIIFLAVRFIRSYLDRQNTSGKPEDHAMTILRERYAKGEIDLEEYNTRKSELGR